MTARSCSLGLVMAALMSVGCDRGAALIAPAVEGAKQSSTMQDLQVVGRAYHDHIDAHGKGPASWDELLTTAGDERRAAVERVRDAGYNVRWSVDFRSATEGTANTVLADNPAGGPRLMLDGSVHQ